MAHLVLVLDHPDRDLRKEWVLGGLVAGHCNSHHWLLLKVEVDDEVVTGIGGCRACREVPVALLQGLWDLGHLGRVGYLGR